MFGNVGQDEIASLRSQRRYRQLLLYKDILTNPCHIYIAMTILMAIFLGAVQGLTEFLPVSSSGHLLMFQHFFGVPHNLLFDIMLHVATLCAVVWVFRQKIFGLVRKPLNKTNLCLLIATAITCTMVLAYNPVMSVNILPITFLITAIVLFATTLIPKGTRTHATAKSSAFIGFVQGIAVLPGISRSGSTIAAGLFTGTDRKSAAEFAFLMSIPIIIASLLFTLISNPTSTETLDFVPLIFGFITALFVGIFAIKFMLHVVQNIKLHYFSFYLVALSVALMLFL